MATKISRGRISPESARAGVQVDSLDDHMVTDLGMEMTIDQMISTEVCRGTTLAGHHLWQEKDSISA